MPVREPVIARTSRAMKTFASRNRVRECVTLTSWWYLLALLATCVAKADYLRQIYQRGGVMYVVGQMAGSDETLPRLLVLTCIMARDVVETGLIALGIFLVTMLTPRRATRIAFCVSSLAVMVLLGANHISVMQRGKFASWDIAETAFFWVWHNPGTLLHYIAPAQSVATLTISWLMIPFAMLYAARYWRPAGIVSGGLPIAIVAAVLGCLALSPVAWARYGSRSFPLQGYWSGFLRAASASDTLGLSWDAVPESEQLVRAYRELAFAPTKGEAANLVPPGLEERIRPRHVLVVGLETAAKALYPLTSSDDLPNFRRMTQEAIVSDRHYTTTPYTRMANFSVLSGLYPPPDGQLPARFGRIQADGVASTLRDRGWETTYIDSWVLDWLPDSGERRQARMLGFDTVIDRSHERDDGTYEQLLAAEAASFELAFSKIKEAEGRGRKAFVFLGTMLGHHPWVAPQGKEKLDAMERFGVIARALDGLFGTLLQRLSEAGLSEEILIVAVGDHGLRNTEEYTSIGRTYAHSDLEFNVPFILFAPGMLDSTITVPYPTSHIDITPTLLHLLGVSTEGMLHHGAYVLDPHLKDRVVFLLNSGLLPVDGYSWDGHHVTHHTLTGEAWIGVGSDPASMKPTSSSSATQLLPARLRDPGTLLSEFAAHTTLVGQVLLQRGARAKGRETVAPPAGALGSR